MCRKLFWKLTLNSLDMCHVTLWTACLRGQYETSVHINKTFRSHYLPNSPALSMLSANSQPWSNGMETDWPGERKPSWEQLMKRDGRLPWECYPATTTVMGLDFDPILLTLIWLWPQGFAFCSATHEIIPNPFLSWFCHFRRNLPAGWNKWPSFSRSGLRIRQFQWVVYNHTSSDVQTSGLGSTQCASQHSILFVTDSWFM